MEWEMGGRFKTEVLLGPAWPGGGGWALSVPVRQRAQAAPLPLLEPSLGSKS